MTALHAVLGAAAAALFAAAGLVGAWRWWRAAEAGPWFWRALRGAQALVALDAALGGVLLLAGRHPDDDLHYLYGLLPLAVAFVAEQLRLAAAGTVLEARGLESSQEVARLPAAEQRSLVRTILRRELGALAAGALVCAGLAIRAGLT